MSSSLSVMVIPVKLIILMEVLFCWEIDVQLEFVFEHRDCSISGSKPIQYDTYMTH